MRGLPDPDKELTDDEKERMYEQMHEELDRLIDDRLDLLYLKKLRDEFAKAAITGILAGKWGQLPQYKPEEAFADFAFRVADEMMKRRDRGNPD